MQSIFSGFDSFLHTVHGYVVCVCVYLGGPVDRCFGRCLRSATNAAALPGSFTVLSNQVGRVCACVGAGKVGKRNERTGISILVLSFTLIKSTSRLEKIYLMCSFKVDGGLLEWVGGLRTRL